MIDRIDVLRANSLTEEQLLVCRSVAVVACRATMISGVDVDAYLGQPERFIASRKDPYSEVVRPDGQRNHNQEYHGTRIALAYDDQGNVVAWGSSTHNVSGGGRPNDLHNTSPFARLNRGLKRVTLLHNYLQLSELYTHPDYQQQGVATALAGRLTRIQSGSFPVMPMSGYVYPGIYKEGFNPQAVLKRHGFYDTKSKIMAVGGIESVECVRMESPSVYSFRRSLDN